MEIAGWSESADPFEITARQIRGTGWLLDPLAPFWLAERLQERIGRLASAAGLCWALRRGKDAVELELLGRAQRVTRSRGIRETLENAVSERAVAARSFVSSRRGGRGLGDVQFGANNARRHPSR